MTKNSKLVIGVGLAAAALALVLPNLAGGIAVLGLAAWNGAQRNLNSAVSSGICCLMEAEVLSSSRIAGCNRRHIHDPGFGSSGEHKLCSDRVPRSHPRSHLRACDIWAWRGKGRKNNKDGHCNRLKKLRRL